MALAPLRNVLPQRDSFESLKAWLADFPDQVDGLRGPFCQTADEYREFFAYAFSRPQDVPFIEGVVAREMRQKLEDYIGNRSGRIYWRIRLEAEIKEHPLPVEFREDGPDIEFITNRRCLMDKDWRRVACYCRLYFAPGKRAKPARFKAV